ncbi:MAG: DNA primase [Planctomycetes bacterium RBG_13_63_9]|nr:MAG: DNA primase [Planctomycetes bacterium RBG_13_63_9]
MDFANLATQDLATQELTVSASSPLDAKEQVRQAIDIVDLVGSHIQLRRQGRNYVGLCPWHEDTRPSLQVNPERQSFRCWVCDIGGDVFSFVMKVEGVEFREALEMLADRVGISVQALRPRGSVSGKEASADDAPAAPSSGEGKRTLYQAMAWAQSKYHACLVDSPEAEPARRYLDQRGISQQSIEQFHLGFSPGQHDWILQQMKGDAARERILETIGLVARSQEGGRTYDRFRGRLLFPIRDAQGRPVGVGGRLLPGSDSTKAAKYINSPETPLFSKSSLLYGLDVARDAMRKSRTALVMEGYTDCVVAQQYGFGDAVAVLGTALGESHIHILKRFADRIVLVLDGDEAGQRRANEVLGLFVAQQVDLQIVTLPGGTDPCDFLQAHGREAFAELLADKAIDALEHAVRAKTRGLDLDRDVHGASQALEELVAIVARAPRLRHDTTREDRFREEKILQRLAARFRVGEKEVRHRLTALRRRAARRVPPAGPAEVPHARETLHPGEPLDPTQHELLELLIAHPPCLPAVRAGLEPEQVAPGQFRQIYETCCRLSDEGLAPDFDRLMLEFDEPAIKSLLVELDEAARAKKAARDTDPETLIRELMRTVEQQEADRQRPGQIVALREAGLDDSQKAELLEKILEQARNRQGISKPTDG